MQDDSAYTTWSAILAILEDKLQYALLKQTQDVVDVRLQGSHLTLFVSSDEALDFFTRDINQQRLRIASRSVVNIDSISVEKVLAEPLR